jgi:hypothetical protein
VFALSAMIRGSAAALPSAEALGQRAAFVDDIVLAAEHVILARLGPPEEPGAQRPAS